jgi:hypothetical protein
MDTNCSQCGNGNDVNARFCSSCGSALTATTDTGVIQLSTEPETGEISRIDHSTFAASKEGMAFLVVRRGAMEGARFALVSPNGESLTLGRSPESNIFLDDVTVSRKHATISQINGAWQLVDSGSLNGTYVNKQRVSETTLQDNDELQVGKYRFVFVLMDGAS